MNPSKFLRSTLHFARQSVTPVFVQKKNGKFGTGTGLLLSFRGARLILTCRHVVEDAKPGGIAFVEKDGVVQRTDAFREMLSAEDRDLVAFRMGDDFALDRGLFFPASRTLGCDVDAGESVVTCGYPDGNRAVEEGAKLDVAAQTVVFASVPYLSVTESTIFNGRLREPQRSIRWRQTELIGMSSFRSLGRSAMDPFVAQGYSGAPVFLSHERKLVGWITDSDPLNDRCLLYSSIRHATHWLERHF
jgi:hypothetical protein